MPADRWTTGKSPACRPFAALVVTLATLAGAAPLAGCRLTQGPRADAPTYEEEHDSQERIIDCRAQRRGETDVLYGSCSPLQPTYVDAQVVSGYVVGYLNAPLTGPRGEDLVGILVAPDLIPAPRVDCDCIRIGSRVEPPGPEGWTLFTDEGCTPCDDQDPLVTPGDSLR